MATYKYRPLSNPRCTRILELEPSSWFKSKLRCRLVEISLDRPPQYNAMSYSWGGQTPQQQILCNDVFLLNVTANVETALRYLRLSDQPHLLWIDSVCIDQSSVPERNQQIQNMKLIYERAGQVIVWLGEAANYSDNAMSTLAKRASRLPAMVDPKQAIPVNYEDVIAPKIAKYIAKAAGAVVPGFSSQVQKVGSTGRGLSNLLSRQVFMRMWCVQEIALGTEVILTCGKSSVTLEQMIDGLSNMELIFGDDLGMAEMVSMYKSRIGLQKELRDIVRATRTNPVPRKKLLLSWVVDATRVRGATEPKDKVFALVGLFQHMGIEFPLPDYSKTVAEVYRDVTLAAMRTDANLDILYQLSGLPNTFQLASWVPDLSDTSPPTPVVANAFNASRNSYPFYRYAESKNILTVRGRTIDNITTCGPALYHPAAPGSQDHPSETATTPALAIFQQWYTLAKSLSSYPTGQPLDEVFGRTLLSDAAIPAVQNAKTILNAFPKWLDVLRSKDPAAVLSEDGTLSKRPAGYDAVACEFDLSLITANLNSIMTYYSKDKTKAKHMHKWLHLVLRRKRLFTTANGLLGIAPASVEQGDKIILIAGLRVPFVLRRSSEGGRLVAPAYVCGVMHGEAWEDGSQLVEFDLV